MRLGCCSDAASLAITSLRESRYKRPLSSSSSPARHSRYKSSHPRTRVRLCRRQFGARARADAATSSEGAFGAFWLVGMGRFYCLGPLCSPDTQGAPEVPLFPFHLRVRLKRSAKRVLIACAERVQIFVSSIADNA